MEARGKIVRCNKDMIGAIGTIPKGKVGGNESNGGGNEGTGMANGGEAIDSAEVARNVNRDEEEIGFEWVKCPVTAVQKRSMNGHLRSKQVVGTPLVRKPPDVVFRWQIVHENLHLFHQPYNTKKEKRNQQNGLKEQRKTKRKKKKAGGP